jgi:CspA family cold shock protein
LAEETSRSTGTVKWFSNEKCYGFIQRDEGPDLFVHYSEIVMDGYKSLSQGQLVEFDITETDKGQQASRVSVVG